MIKLLKAVFAIGALSYAAQVLQQEAGRLMAETLAPLLPARFRPAEQPEQAEDAGADEQLEETVES